MLKPFTITRDALEASLAEQADMETMLSANKYQLPEENSFADVKSRVAEPVPGLAKKLIADGKFIPAGSILSGLGNEEFACSLSNCYLTPIKEDSIEGIFEAQRDLARTFSYRGGSGITLNILRPKGAPVHNAARTSTGAVSFMPVFDSAAKTIGQAGRRAALLMGLDVRHPDILAFIKSKSDPESVFGRDALTGDCPSISGANISVMIPDAFMAAVESGGDWPLIFPDIEAVGKDVYKAEWNGNFDTWAEKGLPFKEYDRLPARDIFNAIAESAHACGDPGVLFIDRVRAWTMGTHINKSLMPEGFNPCGEQPLSFNSNCLLGAIVVSKYITNPYTPDAYFDLKNFELDVAEVVRAMNKYSDINAELHPLKEQRETDAFGKRIGIELTGLADALAMLGMPYDTEKARVWVRQMYTAKAQAEVRASYELALDHGPCPALATPEARERLVNCSYFKHLVKDMDDATEFTRSVKETGLANTALNTIGPCGSISLMAGNCTSGVEPLFKFGYSRTNRIDNQTYNFIHPPACQYMLDNLDEFEGLTLDEAKVKLNYVEAAEVPYTDRIEMQSVLQDYTDSAISSTLNLPEDVEVEDIGMVYRDAHFMALKGVTVFREGCKKGVLEGLPKEAKKGPEGDAALAPVTQESTLYEKELLDLEEADRHRVFWKKAKLYVIVSRDEQGPVEMFAKLPTEAGINGDGFFNPALWAERTSNWDLCCRLISMLLRFGVPVRDIVDQMHKSSYSMVDVASTLKRVLAKYVEVDTDEGATCPSCKENEYYHEGGCAICKACGFTTCG